MTSNFLIRKAGSSNLLCYYSRIKPFPMSSQQVLMTGPNLCSNCLQLILSCPMHRYFGYLWVLKACSSMPCLFTFHLAWTANLELEQNRNCSLPNYSSPGQARENFQAASSAREKSQPLTKVPVADPHCTQVRATSCIITAIQPLIYAKGHAFVSNQKI